MKTKTTKNLLLLNTRIPRAKNPTKTIDMQRDRNRNIMVNNKDFRHITVTGFIGDNNGTPAKKKRAGKGKQQAKHKKVSPAKKELNDAIELVAKAFKVEVAERIGQTENKILELKNKIKVTSNEIGQVYQDHIDKLEYSKRLLVSKLDEYNEIGIEDWNSFKHQFNNEIDDFETSLTNFLKHLKFRNTTEDKASS